MTQTENSNHAIEPADRNRAFVEILSENPELVRAAAYLLGRDKGSSAELQSLLARENRPTNRQGILYALTWNGDARLIHTFTKILIDKSERDSVRGQAAEGIAYLLIKLEPDSVDFTLSTTALLDGLSDPSPEVRYCCLNALGASGHLPFADAISRLLSDTTPVPGFVGTVGEEAQRALEWLSEMATQRTRLS